MRAFLSYTSVDKPFVIKLASDLKGENVQVWLDEWEIRVGSSIVEEIDKALSSNDFFIIVLSPQALQSQWVRKELNSSLMLQLSDRSVKVMPVLHERCDIPTIIKDLKYANFTSDYGKGLSELCVGLGLISSTNWRHINYRQAEMAIYQEMIHKLVNPDPVRGLYINEQMTIIHALRDFPEYYNLSVKHLNILKDSWSTDPRWEPLIHEIDETISYIKKQQET